MKYYQLLLFAIILLNGSCEKFADHSYTIDIKNNSGQIINVYAEYILPDTILSLEKPKFLEIQIGDIEELYDKDVNDQKFNRFKTEKLTIFILSNVTLGSYSWEEIRMDYKILKRYEINEQDLVDMGGSLIYP